MNCSQARRLFSAYMDRDLTFQEESDLRRHLQRCRGCAEEMARLEGVRDLLRALPEADPGPGFYEAVRGRIEAARGDPEPSLLDRRFSLAELLQKALAPARLRPVLGMALGLLVGLVIGIGGSRLGEWWAPGAGTAPSLVRVGDPADLPEDSAVFPDPGDGSETGPLADIDISHLRSPSDSLRLEGEEYILEPYMTDPQRGLVPVRFGHQRTVGSERDAQSDVYIIF